VAESIMLEKAKDFAVNIVNLCRYIKETKRESVLTNQLLPSGTSIGANIHESKYAHGTADFIAKMQIALKECYESEYWLELLKRTGYIPDEQYKPLQNDCGAIRRNVYRVNMKLPKPQDIRPAIVVKNFPVTDYPVLLTDLRIFEDFLPGETNNG